MDKDDILRKIEKCLALAKSSEPAEAAAALRQAQALMREHGVSQLEAQAIGARECSVKAAAASPSRHEAYLAGLVADAFGCELILASGGILSGGVVWLLVGCSPNVEVAQYTLQVLLRLMARARAEHIKAKLKRCGPRTRRLVPMPSARAGSRRSPLVPRMESSGDQKAAIEAHMQLNHPNLGKFTPRSRDAGARGWADQVAGHRAGAGVQLHQGVGASSAPLMLE